MADGNDNNTSNNNPYRRMLEAQMHGRSLDDLLAEHIEAQPSPEQIKNIKIDSLIIKPADTLIRKTKEVLPELPSEFERVLLFSPPFDSWKPYGQGAVVKVNNSLFLCSDEELQIHIYTGNFASYFGYGHGAVVISRPYSYGQFGPLDPSPICLYASQGKKNMVFAPNHNNPFRGYISSWTTYSDGIICKLAGWVINLTAYSDSATRTRITKPKNGDKNNILPATRGVITLIKTAFTFYPVEKNAKGIELYNGGWSSYTSFDDDLIIRLGRKFTRHSAGKESKLLYHGEGTTWKMTGCGLLIDGGDGRLNLRTNEGENFSFKGDINKIVGYPLGMLIEDEAERLWAVRRKRD